MIQVKYECDPLDILGSCELVKIYLNKRILRFYRRPAVKQNLKAKWVILNINKTLNEIV